MSKKPKKNNSSLEQLTEHLAKHPKLVGLIQQLVDHPELQPHIEKMLEIASGPDNLRLADDAEDCVREVSRKLDLKVLHKWAESREEVEVNKWRKNNPNSKSHEKKTLLANYLRKDHFFRKTAS